MEVATAMCEVPSPCHHTGGQPQPFQPWQTPWALGEATHKGGKVPAPIPHPPRAPLLIPPQFISAFQLAGK